MPAVYWHSWLVVVLFLVLGVAMAFGLLGLGSLFRPHQPSAAKKTPYESGAIDIVETKEVRFNVRYYLFALMFVLFDVETVFLFPWAVAFNRLRLFGLIEAFIFLAMLGVGLAYAWKKKVLRWQ